MDNISLFDTAVSAKEVTQLFNEGNDTLSLTEMESSSFSMFPNPVQNTNSVSVSNLALQSVNIFNIREKEINNQWFIDGTFTVETLSTGTYFVKFYNVEQKPMEITK